mmetsp:Transcript_47463/g.72542  ORF Transcript_47463/g.72542 Transcript_47463/m.72542 type:complete len:251 (-) Transcript_47463:439-1191(-)
MSRDYPPSRSRDSLLLAHHVHHRVHHARGRRVLELPLDRLDLHRQPRRLVDGTLGVELRGHVSASHEVDLDAVGLEVCLQLAERVLSGAHDHAVHVQHLGGSLALFVFDRDVQPRVIDLVVGHAADHGDPLVLEHSAVDPPCGLPQACPVLGRFALQEVDLGAGPEGGERGLHRVHSAADGVGLIDAPFFDERVDVGAAARVRRVVRDELSNVESDTAGPDDGHFATHLHFVLKDIHVADYLLVVKTREG